MQSWLAFSWPYHLLSDKALRITVYSCANAPAGPGGVPMAERQASKTAIAPAVIRAAHQILDAHPKILDDPVAIGLVEGSSAAEIRAQAPDLQQPLKRLVRSSFVVRSRFAEDQLAEAVRAGVQQYVLLGAGLDTFAYRQPAWAQPLRIIEVDHPASQ